MKRMSNRTFTIMMLILVPMLIVVVACAPVADDYQSMESETVDDFQNITRTIDREAGVVCWVIDGYREAGISCLPLSETALE